MRHYANSECQGLSEALMGGINVTPARSTKVGKGKRYRVRTWHTASGWEYADTERQARALAQEVADRPELEGQPVQVYERYPRSKPVQWLPAFRVAAKAV